MLTVEYRVNGQLIGVTNIVNIGAFSMLIRTSSSTVHYMDIT